MVRPTFWPHVLGYNFHSIVLIHSKPLPNERSRRDLQIEHNLSDFCRIDFSLGEFEIRQKSIFKFSGFSLKIQYKFIKDLYRVLSQNPENLKKYFGL